MSWQLQPLEVLASKPTVDTDEAEKSSIEMSLFISHTPTDFLEPLLSSPFGRVYKLFLERCCTKKFLGTEAENRRNALSQQLRHVGCESPEGWGLLLALFPFFPPNELKVEDAASKMPNWLHSLYVARYEAASQSPTSPRPEGESGFEDRVFLNKILGLSNLYYIDPEDQEILLELREVRLKTIELMLSVSRDDLGHKFQSDFGDRYWAMAQSGIQKESLDANEIKQRDEIQQWLSQTPNSIHQDGGIQRFAAALLFNPPGSIRLADPDRNLPAWFREGFKRYCSMAKT